MKINLNFKKKNKVLKKEEISANLTLCWTIILLSFFLIVLGSFAYGLVLYLKVNKQFFAPTELKLSIEEEQKKKLNEALEYFSKQREASRAIIIAPPSIVDPSI